MEELRGPPRKGEIQGWKSTEFTEGWEFRDDFGEKSTVFTEKWEFRDDFGKCHEQNLGISW